MNVRLDHLLAGCGYGSRREVSALIRAGVVRVKGKPVRDPSHKTDPQGVTVGGTPLDHPSGITVVLNKPAGYVCSHDSADGSPVYRLLPAQWMRRNPGPVSAGRLDKDTTGAVIITTDTALVHRLISPRHSIEKEYEVTVDSPLRAELIEMFNTGTLMLKGEPTPCRPARLDILSENIARIVLTEGRYHQVKRMFAAASYHVASLRRVRIGPVELGELAEGAYRELTPSELDTLEAKGISA